MTTEQQIVTETADANSVGALLRQERETRGISLETVAEATKIGKNYLRALEEDRYQDLPAAAYLPGFIRAYATYLGLPVDELVRRATAHVPVGASETATVNRPVVTRNGIAWQRFILPVILLAAVLISTFFLSLPSPERPHQTVQPQVVQPPPIPAAAVQPPRSSVSAPVAAAQETDKPAPPVETAPEQQVTPVPPAKPQSGFMVRMKVKRNSNLTVTIDDAATQGYELTSGDLIEWKAARTIVFDLSDVGGVEVELNGTPLKLPDSASGRSAYLVLDANGIRREHP